MCYCSMTTEPCVLDAPDPEPHEWDECCCCDPPEDDVEETHPRQEDDRG